MLKKYIKLFLESSSFQSSQPVQPSYREIAKQVEDQNRINLEKVKRRELSSDSSEDSESIDIEKYSNLLKHS